MIIVQSINIPIILLLLINISDEHFHAPLRRSFPTLNLEKNKLTKRSIDSSLHKLVNLVQMKINGRLNLGYYISLGIGTPPQKFNFVIDTGSSNMAVAGVPNQYITKYFEPSKSNSFTNYGIDVFLPYDTATWKGRLGSDIVTFDDTISIGDKLITNPLKIKSNFTVIQSSKGFFLRNANWEGIMGLAYSVLSQPKNLIHKSTLFDTLVQNSKIPDMFSIALCGHNKNTASAQTQGYFIAGGMNESLFVPPMVNIMIRRRWFYEVIISRISISDKPIIISSCKEYNNDKTIMDTGTTDTLLPKHVFRSLVQSIINNLPPHPFSLNKNSAFWNRKAVLCTISANINQPPSFFPDIHFHLVINDTASLHLSLSPQQYISYVGDQMDVFDNKRSCYKFGFGESKSGTILGDTFIEGFYLVFNRANDTIGIAQSTCNNHFPGFSRSRIISVYTNQRGLLSCGVTNRYSGFMSFITSTITLLVCLIIGLMLLIMLIVILILQLRKNNDLEAVAVLSSEHHVQGTTQYRSFD